ncbi:MAG: arylsulfatase [Planctomycetota bacterium]|nr:arylsulfatase [Planctomycetota bacterium]
MGHTRAPNIVVILADDLGYGDVSCCNEAGKITTPFMDAIAEQGVLCTDAHSNSAVCTPTRYGLLTGRYAWRTRLKRSVLFGYSHPLVEPGRETLATLLKRSGYHTACIGKWHLGLGWCDSAGVMPPGRDIEHDEVDFSQPLAEGPHSCGFDESYIIPASLDMAPYCYIHNGRVTELPTASCDDSERPAFWRGGACSPGFQHETCLLEFTRRAEAYIDSRAAQPDQPFMLYFPTPSPHTPHVPRAPFVGSTELGAYGDFVVEHDWSIGQIMAALERNGMADNTLVVVTSDNGCHSGPLGLEQFGHLCNHIYRGQKSDAWDGGHRVPFLARWPGTILAGSRCDQTLCLTDLLATCAAIVDDEIGPEAGEDSYNILPALTGQSDQAIREATIHHSIDGAFAIRQGPWKMIFARGSGGWSLPEKDVDPDAPDCQLYHMDNDPSEQRNRIATEPAIAATLSALVNHYRDTGRSVPVG